MFSFIITTDQQIKIFVFLRRYLQSNFIIFPVKSGLQQPAVTDFNNIKGATIDVAPPERRILRVSSKRACPMDPFIQIIANNLKVLTYS